MIEYPAILEKEKKGKRYNLYFPDLPGCITCGDTLEETLDYGKEALTGYLESIDSRKLKIPHPSKKKGKNIYFIAPNKNVGLAVWLKWMREQKGFSQEDVAEKLGIAYQTYQKFENPNISNPTLKTIVKLESVFGKELIKI